MKPYDNLIFDLDGTLTDPKTGITRSVQFALTELGLEAPTENELEWCIGPPIRQSLLKLLHDDDQATTKALELYRRRFSEIGLFENVPYAGIFQTLSHLQADGYRLLVATSKPRVFARRILTHFSLSSYFEKIYGAELDGTNSNKTALLRFVLAQERITPASCLMIGDRSHDIIGARANDIDTLGVTYGYGSKEELLGAGAMFLCGSPAELTKSLIKATITV